MDERPTPFRADARGVCAVHPERPASFECARCGDYGCRECENRAVPDAQPICSVCWARREAHVAKMPQDDAGYVAWFAPFVGLLALVPCMIVAQIGSIVLGTVGLRRAKENALHRTLSTIGIILGCLGLLIDLVFLVLMGDGGL